MTESLSAVDNIKTKVLHTYILAKPLLLVGPLGFMCIEWMIEVHGFVELKSTLLISNPDLLCQVPTLIYSTK